MELLRNGIDVFCVPTHHYCNLGCKFCHLTEENKSNKKMLKIHPSDLKDVIRKTKRDENFNNVLLSFMGVGEPFFNQELIVKTYESFKNEWTDVSLALATMMPSLKPIEFFAEKVKMEQMPLKITFSLHSPIDSKRKIIIPSSSISVETCLEALVSYREVCLKQQKILDNFKKFHSSDTPILLHYAIIEGVNDTSEELEKLIGYGEKYKIPLKILKFNPTKYLKRSSKEKIWLNVLKELYPAPVVYYAPPGANIGSSCGQFTKHYYLGSHSDEEQVEFENWKKRYEV